MRVAENLNAALHGLLDDDPTAYLLGEDILDPYGGAFKVTKGLSTRFPGRVIGTPISEGALTGVAAYLALTGNTAVAEIMFGDFVALAFDQLCNFASKSVSMYGRRLPLRMVVRCPTGGGRGYGPTHSQSLQKHFVGMPGLSLYEMSPSTTTARCSRRCWSGASRACSSRTRSSTPGRWTWWTRCSGCAVTATWPWSSSTTRTTTPTA
ncbi:hypothetical protein ACFQX6_28000 [Streptosporangium lutulentum]